MRVLLILKQSITQAGHAPLVALHVILQVMAGDESFSTGRKGAGKRPLVGVGSRVLLQVALCCEKTRTTRLTTVECVSWGKKTLSKNVKLFAPDYCGLGHHLPEQALLVRSLRAKCHTVCAVSVSVRD